MALFTRNVGNVIRNVVKFIGAEQPVFSSTHKPVPWQAVQVRNRYVNWKMLRDAQRRQLVKQHAVARLRVNALRRNTILPQEIQDIAFQEIKAFPVDSCRTRTVPRCVLTSRPRGVVHPWHLSRIMWRLLADYNKLSGVMRAKW